MGIQRCKKFLLKITGCLFLVIYNVNASEQKDELCLKNYKTANEEDDCVLKEKKTNKCCSDEILSIEQYKEPVRKKFRRKANLSAWIFGGMVLGKGGNNLSKDTGMRIYPVYFNGCLEQGIEYKSFYFSTKVGLNVGYMFDNNKNNLCSRWFALPDMAINSGYVFTKRHKVTILGIMGLSIRFCYAGFGGSHILGKNGKIKISHELRCNVLFQGNGGFFSYTFSIGYKL